MWPFTNKIQNTIKSLESRNLKQMETILQLTNRVEMMKGRPIIKIQPIDPACEILSASVHISRKELMSTKNPGSYIDSVLTEMKHRLLNMENWNNV